MSEERRLKEANEKLLSNICNEVVKAAGSGNNSQPLDTVKQIISEHKVCGHDPKSVVFIRLGASLHLFCNPHTLVM